jgi:hypothetical protein
MTLFEFCAESLARDVPPEISALAEKIRMRHEGVMAMLAYGSCLRGIDPRETLSDYYILTENLTGVSSSIASRIGCRLAPPNVYYMEEPIGGDVLRAKYAALPMALFEERVARGVRNPYFWARFAQPSALVYARDEMARTRAVQAVTSAHETFYANALALENDQHKVWAAGFRATYASELRPEPPGKAQEIVSANAAYYARASRLMHCAA